MKYIKQYEDKIEDRILLRDLKFPVLDKYLLYKANNTFYFILEVTGYEDNYIATKKLFIYTVLTDRIKRGSHQYYNIGINNINNIIYQSNNLKEVKDAIPILKNLDKYNI